MAADAGHLPKMPERAIGVDASLTSNAAYVEVESSARLRHAAGAGRARYSRSGLNSGLVTMPAKPHVETAAPAAR